MFRNKERASYFADGKWSRAHRQASADAGRMAWQAEAEGPLRRQRIEAISVEGGELSGRQGCVGAARYTPAAAAAEGAGSEGAWQKGAPGRAAPHRQRARHSAHRPRALSSAAPSRAHARPRPSRSQTRQPRKSLARRAWPVAVLRVSLLAPRQTMHGDTFTTGARRGR